MNIQFPSSNLITINTSSNSYLQYSSFPPLQHLSVVRRSLANLFSRQPPIPRRVQPFKAPTTYEQPVIAPSSFESSHVFEFDIDDRKREEEDPYVNGDPDSSGGYCEGTELDHESNELEIIKAADLWRINRPPRSPSIRPREQPRNMPRIVIHGFDLRNESHMEDDPSSGGGRGGVGSGKEAEEAAKDMKMCVICRNGVDSLEWLDLTCGHCYHKDCIFIWLNHNNSCPICRLDHPHVVS